MLTRSLALAVIWLVLSAIVTLVRGATLRRAGAIRSIVWLVVVIVCGDVWPLVTFGDPLEVGILSLLALLNGLWWIYWLPNWNGLGHTTWAMSVLATALYLIYSAAVTAFTPLHPLGFLVSCFLFAIEAFALGLSLSFTYETLDVCTRLRWRRRFRPAQAVAAGYVPKVSLHLPAYNEPPEVVGATLRKLAALDYPNFEVLLVDNNTPDEVTWRPLENICRELGPNFKCIHLDKWPGYKSGALNFALAQTAPDAEIVGIIDADYQVLPEYLRETVPYFSNPEVAFLQTPQDYRAYEGNSFFEACYDSYKYFFEVSMPSRNEHNAIIFGGTMGLIRKSVLQDIGGWDEWCITEDAEASLRILKLGYQSVYINRSYGRGIMPLNFEGLKKQRFRWCFGGIQILRKHWEALMPWARWVDPSNRLRPVQRYYYLTGSVQWFNEVLTLIFTALLLLGGAAIFGGWGGGVRPFVGAIAVVPLVFLFLGLWRFLWALRHTLNISWGRALRAMGVFFSLSWVVTLGCIQGLIQPRGVFLRTPKVYLRSGLLRTLRVTLWESSFGIACLLLGAGLALTHLSLAVLTVVVLLFWQASLYLAAPWYSLLSERAGPVRITSRGDIQGRSLAEGRAARWSLALALLLVLSCGLLNFLPKPAATPHYSQFQPQEMQARELVGMPPLPTTTNLPTQFPTPVPASVTLASSPTVTQTPPSITLTQSSALSVSPTAATHSAPTQIPTQQSLPTPIPTQAPLPTQVLTQPPLPTQVPTQPPVPTKAPIQPSKPTQRPHPH